MIIIIIIVTMKQASKAPAIDELKALFDFTERYSILGMSRRTFLSSFSDTLLFSRYSAILPC